MAEITLDEAEAMCVSQEFIDQVDDVKALRMLFIVAMTLPISKPNSTFQQKITAIEQIATKKGYIKQPS